MLGSNVSHHHTTTLAPLHPTFRAGQPVLIGGTMGTCSYVLTGTQTGMEETFGSTCHGAGRAQSRNASRRKLEYLEVLVHYCVLYCMYVMPCDMYAVNVL